MKILAINNDITFGEIDGDGGFFSMHNLGKSGKQYDCELRAANLRYIKEQKAKLKAHKLEQLNVSIKAKNLNFAERIIYNFKKLIIKLM